MLEKVILGNTIRNYLWFLFYVLLGIIISWVSIFVIKNIFVKLTKYTKNKIDDIIAKILSKPMPIKLIILIIFVNIGFRCLEITPIIAKIIDKATFIAVVLAITLFLIKFFLGLIEVYLEPKAKKTDSKYDDQVIPVLKSITKITFFVVGFLIVLSNLGYNVTALLAGLGIGGIAIAFAAKDILENFISGITIFLEKPFKVGDFLKTSEGTGTVEEIGIRSTKIRTADNTVIVLPNRLLSSNSVENVSVRRARRENYLINLVYGTPEKKIQKAQEIIKKILNKNKDVVEQDSIIIGFEEFGAFSLNIRVIYWIKADSYSTFIDIKNKINSTIKREFEKEKIEFAYPTQTVNLKK